MKTYFIKGMVALAFAVSPFLFVQILSAQAAPAGQVQVGSNGGSGTPSQQAEDTSHGLNDAAGAAGINPAANIGTPESINATIGYLIGQVLTFVGIIFLILMVYGGIQWMIASKSGKEEDVTKAQKTLYGAIIGMVIVFASYAVTAFVMDILTKAGTVAK